ncbi:hypothetical protein Kpol_543p79 [Vanderwaltozyma polyspora DSM 70294]|uniref:Amino acid permease/ SLC12A domain-containing protein n=1 Tax=Vanderwaltozyma polyspora (strain ATCC 22028 / DSM 70294 / BCRC 21397 / CBS 2163 / NBRC 10782 / NRRL Y-8283 / UCD 57-17) TaxID=436907 RepID=A7THT4_VANPO|nr:uncharacterized protein Kpol_543p79 [Vanderwaltozyma polyspora DSM 70294]EDO18250.1 hypothetical protein Kpol_543p79 [Vanderwaltozyma polyspora DSM 70294]
MSSPEEYNLEDRSKEKNITIIRDDFSGQDIVSESLESFDNQIDSSNYASHRSAWGNFLDSFKRVEVEEVDPNLTDLEKIAIKTARSPLQHKLKSRHLQMIAIGGAIGTGLFVGSGRALRTAGPAGILIGWSITGTMIFTMVMALGELAVMFPVSGGFTTYATRFIDESFGFACNFNYMLQWLVVLPLEIVAASITVAYWETPVRYTDGFVALFWLVVVIINMFGVRGYGEAEFVFSIIKVTAVIGFIILGIVLVCGGGPVGGYVGARYWHNPGAFVGSTSGQKFHGFCSVFVTAAFSFAGSELIGLAGSEAKNPRKAVPSAAKQVFWRILLFYIICLLLIGFLVPYNDPRLISSSSVDASASPFVIAIVTHGISGLPSVINVVILISVLSVGNSAIYSCSRTLVALSEQGFLPKIVSYIDRKGRPLVGIAISSTFGLIAFVAASNKQNEMFNWLLAISGLSSFFTWSAICICHIRFRGALKAQGRGTDELPFVSPAGVIGSYWGLFLNILMLIAQFYIALFPIGGSPSAYEFFSAYLAAPVILAFYIAHKLWKKNWKFLIPLEDVDIDTGRRDTDVNLLKQEIAEEKAALAMRPWWYRVYVFWCA